VAILLFFFVSGGCGLLYQVVWTRKLVLLFGATAYAVSTVLTIFFIGLGAGSIWGGRLADRISRPLVVYGLFELLIAFWAVLFLFIIGWGESVVVGILRASAFSRGAGIGLRALLALVFLIIPVFLMGATLPLLARVVSADRRVRGLRIGALYSVNTFGAVAGCACTGFLILPQFGYTGSTYIGAAANAAIGLSAILLGFRFPAPAHDGNLQEEDQNTYVPPNPEPRTPNPEPSQYLILAAFAVSGFCALALEVLWTRLLTLIFVGTTYAFTTMLTTLLCGIAAGSAVASLLVDRRRRRVLLFGMVEMLIGISCVAMLAVFAGLPQRLSEMQLEAGYAWDRIIQAKFALSFMVLFAPTFLFGMTFPIVVKSATSRGARVGRDIGRLYSANTFGGVLGAAAGGFLLIPLLGTHHGITALSAALFAVGIVLTVSCPASRFWSKAAAIAAGCVLMALSARVAPSDVAVALNAGYIPADHAMLDCREGIEGTVAVSEPRENSTGSDRVLWINAVQATASIEKGVKMNRFQGILPLLFDRDPRLVLFMCFGSGITAGTLGLYDFDRIDAVEISREVLDVAPYFAKDNFDVIANPKIRLIVDDGRNFLVTATNRYDVITFEPMPLALAGVSTFYTREYYALCLEHLAPGGMVSQWIPLHSLDTETVRSLIYTFTAVFPEYCAWFVNADLFMVGSNAPLHIDYARMAQRLSAPAIQQAIREVGFKDVIEVAACFFMGKQHVDAFARGGSAMTDDRPWAEFIAPKLMYTRTVDKSLDHMAPFFESPTVMLAPSDAPQAEAREVIQRLDRRHLARVKNLEGLKQYYGGTFGAQPETFFKQALDIDPDDYTSRYYLKEVAFARAKTFVRWQEIDKAIACLTDAIKYAPDMPELHLALGDIYHDQSLPEKARAAYAAYIALGGTADRALERSAAGEKEKPSHAQ
jgi:spermidine synthase